MTRDASSSPSEGEIVESDSEKANSSTNKNHGTSVDRQSRLLASSSRSPSPYRSSRSQHTSSTVRKRSASPYRQQHHRKRHHGEGFHERAHNDLRRFKVHYENPKGGSDGGHFSDRSSVASNGIGHKHPTNHGREHVKPFSIGYKATREGSNASFPSDPTSDSQSRGQNADLQRRDLTVPKHDDSMEQRQVSRDNRESFSHSQLKQITEQSVSRHKLANSHVALINNDTTDEYVPVHPIESRADGSRQSYSATKSKTVPRDIGSLNENRPDDAAVIEERRKRREAIKAKHRDQATSRTAESSEADLVSDHNGYHVARPQKIPNAVAMQSPAQLRVPAVGHNSSDYPNLDSSVNNGSESPTNLVIEDDYELANERSAPETVGDEDGPSAADYDPKMDMQEDRLRQEQQEQADIGLHQADGTYDNIHTADELTTQAANSEQLVSDGFDMFAEGDDTDMFVDKPVPTNRLFERAQDTSLSHSQAIDTGMLDDWDDSEGYYKIVLGEVLDNRYRVQSNLGKGMFSGVVRATDQKANRLVAIKVVRNNETMYKAGQKEIDILQSLRIADPEDRKHLVRLERSFEHKGHLCMVFENLSINLREVLKKFGRDIGINLKAVRAYAQQMFLGLGLLRKCNLLHADIKPDNILVNENRNMLKICDLGSASDASDNEVTQYLVSRFYRAPEIILGLPFDFAIDMWSVGCTLFELYSGKILFTGRNNNQMLRSMMECRGKFSHKLLRKAQFVSHHFDDLLNFKSLEKDRLTGRDTVRLLNYNKPTRDLRARLLSSTKGMSETEVKEVTWFVDLLEKCLSLNPEKRCTPAEALKHPFILRPKT